MNLYNFYAQNIKGEKVDFSTLKGKKVMIVNTASECGLTPQYEQLEELYQNTSRNNFEVIAFPCNDFGEQEPGSEGEIVAFCQKNYGVSFPLMTKIKVKGEQKHPLYKWLLEESAKNNEDEEVKWNFHKFLIDENGKYVKSIAPTTSPLETSILNWING